MLNIYDIEGTLLLSVPETDGCEHIAELMNSDYVKLSFVSVTGDDLPQGAYIVFKGETYRLFEPYTPGRSNEVEYKYEPKFHSKVMGWAHKPFFFLETDEGVVLSRETEWTLTGTVTDFLNRVIASIEDETGEAYSFDYDLALIGGKTIQFQAMSILDGLNAIAEAWDTEWWVSGTVIHLSKCAHSTAIALTVGMNVGVPTVTRNDEGYFTRFYAFGSTRNIPQDYTSASSSSHVVKKRLTLPAATCPNGYKDIRPELTSVEVNTKVLIFDDVYPKSALTISSVRFETRYHFDENGNRIPTGEEIGGVPQYDVYRVFYFKINGFTFDLESIIEGETLSVHFESGNLAGWDFELAYHPEDEEYEIIFDESTGYVLPNDLLAPAAGDQLVLFNIDMPSEYIASAEAELEDRLDEKMTELASNLSTYQVNSYPVEFAVAGISLTVGRNVNFTSGALSHSTRVLAITEKLDDPYTVSIKLGEKAVKKTTKRLQEEIVDVNRTVQAVATKLLNVSRARRNWKNTGELLDMVFDPDGYFDPQNIRPQSIETMMLKVGTRSQQLSINSTIEPNYGGDPNEVRVSAGSLAHYGMGEAVLNWNIGASSVTLASTGPYYIYAKCSKSDATAQVLLSQAQIMADDDPDYYHFLLGVLHSVESGVRWISLTYGATAINGRYITTGKITSQDGLNYFDLDQNQLKVGDSNSSLDWNVTTPNKLTIKGGLIQRSAESTPVPITCFRGTYDPAVKYFEGDIVTHEGASYVHKSTLPSIGIAPGEQVVRYGLKYNWFAVVDPRNIAAEGWHAPDPSEFLTLRMNLDPVNGASTYGNNAGARMKETGFTYWSEQMPATDNSSKFNGRGSGYRMNGVFESLGYTEVFWTTRNSGVTWAANAILSALTDYFTGGSNGGYDKITGEAVRLIKDTSSLSHGESGIYVGNDGRIYPTINIHGQEWLACNLAETKFRDGTTIPEVTEISAWNSLSTAALCAYDNDWGYVFENAWEVLAVGSEGADGTTYMVNASTNITIRKTDGSYDPAFISVRLVRKIGSGDPTNINFYYRTWVTNDGVTFFMYSQGGPSSSINYYFPSNPNMVALYVELFLDSSYSQPIGRAGVAVLSQADLGQVGPSVVYTGEFSASKVYYNNTLRRDIVKYSDQYYIYSGTNGTSGAWNASNWQSFGGNFESIATGLLFSEFAFVDNLGVRVLQGMAMPVGDLAGTVTNITPNISPEPEWDPDTYYNVDDKCSDSGINYVCLIANIGEPLNLPYWSTSTPQPQKRKDRITLSGTSGSANITCDGITRRIDYSALGLEQTAADFVVLYASAWLAGGVVLTSEDEDLVLESTVAGQNFSGNTTISNKPNFYRGSIVVRGNEIWEDNEDNDLYGVVAINRRGYHGGHTRSRFTLVGDGKGNTVLGVVPVDAGGMFKGLNLVAGMPLRLAQMGTTQINALTATEGTLAYDIVTHTLKVYTNAGWRTVQTS